jgi:hypothetical protein
VISWHIRAGSASAGSNSKPMGFSTPRPLPGLAVAARI